MHRLFPSILVFVAFLVGCGKSADPGSDEQAAAGQPAPEASAGTMVVIEPAADAAALPADFKLTSFKWDGPMAVGEKLRVRNPYGDIRCRKSGTGELIVTAQIQTFTDWQPAPQLEVLENNGAFEVRIVHPQSNRAEFGGDYKTGFAGRIDVTVLLPPGTVADLGTTDGALRVKNFDGDLKARTESGELYYKSAGSFHLETGSGAVEATIADFSASKRGEINTREGAVSLSLGAGASATVAVESAGAIDFRSGQGVNAEEKREKDGLLLNLREGGRRLKISSETGDVVVRAD